ncbi:MAG: hypothetical protein HQM04_18155 [Magnetococcales bacterium]|nr:hypothetical protein [Magnetococcales bacterium]MBF0116951.1 hypothetical protein [Magnetococcales bacterium]
MMNVMDMQTTKDNLKERLVSFSQRHNHPPELIEQALHLLGDSGLSGATKWRHPPVSIREFIANPQFLGNADEVYPALMEVLEELGSGKYVEAVLTGAIGTGKTSLALWVTAYSLYQLSCMSDPHGEFDLARSSEITIIFQSITKDLAKGVDYRRFRAMIERAPYFQRHFPFDKNIESEMQFPNQIIVKPVAGTETAAIGQNVIGGVIDELNYMSIIEKSKVAVDRGTYDQAVSIYNSIARRRKSRFMKKGKLPGILCLVSSKRYPGQFTDQKEKEARTDPTIYVYDKRTWDIKPWAFSGKTFPVFVGDEARNPRILYDGDEVGDGQVMDIPVEYLREFETDIMNALRDIAGVSTQTLRPFLVNREAVVACFGTHPSILGRNDVAWPVETVDVLIGGFHEPERKRWAHVDLSLTSDSTGIVMGYVTGFARMDRGDTIEILPRIEIDFALEVRPPKGGEISFEKIRTLFCVLRDQGMNLKWISFDSYQSADSIQILRQKGFMTDTISMDKNTAAYDMLKTALYDRRVAIPDHPKLMHELLSLEFDTKRGKVDHPPLGSKDLSDALAGVVFGLSTRREIWWEFGIPPDQIPESLYVQASKANEAAKAHRGFDERAPAE